MIPAPSDRAKNTSAAAAETDPSSSTDRGVQKPLTNEQTPWETREREPSSGSVSRNVRPLADPRSQRHRHRARRDASAPFIHGARVETAKTATKRTALARKMVQKTSKYPTSNASPSYIPPPSCAPYRHDPATGAPLPGAVGLLCVRSSARPSGRDWHLAGRAIRRRPSARRGRMHEACADRKRRPIWGSNQVTSAPDARAV